MEGFPAQQTDNYHRAQLLDTVMQSATEGVVIVRGDKKVLYANPSMEKITGFTCEELMQKGEGFLRHETDAPVCQDICEIAHNVAHFRREVTVHKKNGGESHVLLSLDTLRNGEGQIEYFVGLLTDVTEIKRSREKLAYLATHDNLTQLPNRTMLEERAEQALSRADRTQKLGALLFVDVDYFKEINDTLGHCVGDSLLKLVAQRLKDVCRKQDFVARYGGDEFVLILEDMDRVEDVHLKAEELLTSLNRRFSVQCHEPAISASIGAALFPRDGKTFNELVQRADIAMYAAKKAGRNRHCIFDPENPFN